MAECLLQRLWNASGLRLQPPAQLFGRRTERFGPEPEVSLLGLFTSESCVEQPIPEIGKEEETVIAVNMGNEALCFLLWPSAELRTCL